jgi:diketogulonate reductase-like aldo/keto reductase
MLTLALSHADPEAALKETLQQLGLTYLDLYLVHWPMGNANGGGTKFDVVNVSKCFGVLILQILITPYTDMEEYGKATSNETDSFHWHFQLQSCPGQ